MLSASCHCGAVTVSLPRRPRRLTNCNCSICRRIGALWAYYKQSDVQISADPDSTHAYVWGDKTLRIMRCRHCGNVTHWEPLRPGPGSRMGVNARLFDPAQIGAVRVRLFDGALTWKFVD